MRAIPRSDSERLAILEGLRAAKMAKSPHAFVRGNTEQHYEWMAGLDVRLPEGPALWICGDCHVGNLGPLADGDGNVDIQIRDLDQATFGNPVHDIVRLALSLASAARGSNLPGATTARMIEEMVIGYEEGLQAIDDETLTRSAPDIVKTVRRKAMGRKWKHLASDRLEDLRPSIPLGRKFWPLEDDEKWNVGLLLDNPRIKKLILSLSGRSSRSRVELIDAAYWVKGCSSLGKLRYAALVRLAGKRRNKLSLIDIKEAVRSAAPSLSGIDVPVNHAERVVAGARALSPNLGDRMAAGEINGKPVVVRELMPEDLKLEIEQFSREEAVRSARYLTSVVGRAHGRQMTPDTRQAWNRELKTRHSADLAAPTWLWEIVVKLMVLHEEAYLKHCRIYAFMDQARMSHCSERRSV